MKQEFAIKFMIKAQRVNANTSYYLFKWDRRYVVRSMFVKFIDGDYLADFGIDITLGETV